MSIVDKLNEDLSALLDQQQKDVESPYFDSVVYDVFNNAKGKELIGLLEKYFIKAPVAPPGYGEAYAYFREGQNNFIRLALIGAIERHQQRRGSNA